MTLHDLFEIHYAEHNDTTPGIVRGCRMSNGSYNNLPIARAFRMFRAGYEAHKVEQFEVLGYLSDKGILSASQARAAFFGSSETSTKSNAVYVKTV